MPELQRTDSLLDEYLETIVLRRHRDETFSRTSQHQQAIEMDADRIEILGAQPIANQREMESYRDDQIRESTRNLTPSAGLINPPRDIDPSAGLSQIDPIDHLTSDERTEADNDPALRTDKPKTVNENGKRQPRIRLAKGAELLKYTIKRTATGLEFDFTAHKRLAAWLRRLAIDCQADGRTSRTVRDLASTDHKIVPLDGLGSRVWELNLSRTITRGTMPNLRLDQPTDITHLGWLRLTAGGTHRTFRIEDMDDPCYWFMPTGSSTPPQPRIVEQINRNLFNLAYLYVELPNVVTSRTAID
jgi:hypothetical protein